MSDITDVTKAAGNIKPVYWVGIIGGGVLIGLYLRHRSSTASANTGTSTVDTSKLALNTAGNLGAATSPYGSSSINPNAANGYPSPGTQGEGAGAPNPYPSGIQVMLPGDQGSIGIDNATPGTINTLIDRLFPAPTPGAPAPAAPAPAPAPAAPAQSGTPYNPALIAAGEVGRLDHSLYSGFYSVGADGAVYAWGGAPYFGGPNGQPYWGDRRASQIVEQGTGYCVIATSGERYCYGPNGN